MWASIVCEMRVLPENLHTIHPIVWWSRVAQEQTCGTSMQWTLVFIEIRKEQTMDLIQRKEQTMNLSVH